MNPAQKQQLSSSKSLVTTDNSSEIDQKITLSRYTIALIETLKNLPAKIIPDDLSKLIVSQTVSFLAIAYEKVRRAIEYQEESVVRRSAMERIIKRRLSMNPDGKGEAENILRELTWARYFPNGSLGEDDIIRVQRIVDVYIYIRKRMITGRNSQAKRYLHQYIIDLLTCEIEDSLSPNIAARESAFTYFLYQTLRNKIEISGVKEIHKDTYFLAAIERTFRKSDTAYLRYHLFSNFYEPLSNYSQEELDGMMGKLPHIFKKIDDVDKNPYADALRQFIRKQLPSYLILFDIVRNKFAGLDGILQNKKKLWQEVDMTCREKYQQSASKLRILAIKSLIYIFITKMLFAIILEYPVSLYLYNEVNLVSIGINSLFPPVLMLVIVLLFRVPGDNNTARIYHRIINIVDADKTFENQKIVNLAKKKRQRRPTLVFGFTLFYSLTFIITLFIINRFLTLLNFNAVSQLIFIFFVSVITFFAYRIKNVVREYRLIKQDSVLGPFGDFFFMPIVSLGKFFSTQLGRMNFFTVIFDFLIEAPFKLLIEIVEEWIKFVRVRKEELT